jgi:hypothetical protein
LRQLCENASVSSLKNMSAFQIANAYVANYVAALVLIRAEDTRALQLLNDKSHVKLNSFSNNMSRPNFWGFMVFNSNVPNAKKLMPPGAASELAKNAGRIVDSRRVKLQTYTTMKDNQIDWTDASYSIKLLKVRFNLTQSNLDNIANGIYSWESLDEMAKGDLLQNSFLYLMQSDSQSDLLPRLRLLTNKKFLTVNSVISTIGQKLNKVFRLGEDGADGGGMGVGSGGGVGFGSGAAGSGINQGIENFGNRTAPGSPIKTPDGTSSKDVANLPFRLKFEKGKIVKKKKRKWKIRKWKDPVLIRREF